MAAHTTATGLEIAVVGMAGRFPTADSVDALWERLVAAQECISFFSEDEVRAAGVDAAMAADPNYVRAGGVVAGEDLFDAAFFGYSPREAALIDPQQRVFLELAWAALENAGYAPGTVACPVGVYGGVGLNDYFLKHVRGGDTVGVREMAHVANDKDFLTTRISYKLNLEGPSLAVQTACSTSLVAVHLACQGLVAGECDMALAGGITIRLPQNSGYLAQDGGMASPDGHCRAFSSQARGCLPGNGGGIVVLKRLSDAIAAGDFIHAVIKGSAINNDGAQKVGYTAPRVEGQARVIRAALHVAGTPAETIGYLEAHGTGTILGDPIEIQAATAAYRQQTSRRQFCAIGSIKTNLGHLDAGAGVAGLIKAVLAVKHGVQPASLHCDVPNPSIDFEGSPFYVNTTTRPWPREAGIRRAGVSSFGIGGTNAHVIVEEPPVAARSNGNGAELLLVSAKTETALDEAAANLAAHLRACPDANLADVAYTLRCGRAHMPHRRAVVCRQAHDAVASLSAKPLRARPSGPKPTVVFMFPGQGSQYPGMGQRLYQSQPVFRRWVDAAAEILRAPIGLDLRDVIAGPVDSETARAVLRDTTIAQPAIFTVAYALSQQLLDWHIRPSAMIGHSIGEYVAACVAGVLSFEDALWLVSERGKLMGRVAAGAMLAVPLDADIESVLPENVDLAATNAPGLSVVSGPTSAIDAFERSLKASGIEARRLHTSHAFHSRMMDEVLGEFAERCRRVPLHAPAIPYVSNLTGDWITPQQATDPGYWTEHLRRTVQFSAGLKTLLADDAHVLLEVGPSQTLTTLARRHARPERPVASFATMHHPDDPARDDVVILEALGGVWSSGVDVDWSRVQPTRARRVPLPTYPFQHERFWLDAPAAQTASTAAARRPDVTDWFSAPSWERLPAFTPDTDDSAAGRGGARTAWLVLLDGHGLGDELTRALGTRGCEVFAAKPAPAFSELGDRIYGVRPDALEDWLELCGELRVNGVRHLNVLHCWTAEPDAAVRAGRDALSEYEDRGFYSVLFLGQALGAQAWLETCRVVVISSNLYDVVGTELLCPEKATVVGPSKVLPLEDERMSSAHIDVVVPTGGSAALRELATLLLETVDGGCTETIAIRGRHRWHQTLVPVKLGQAAAPVLKPRGVYVITGGLGGVALALAEHLARTVQARLVLVPREPVPATWQPRARTAAALPDVAVAIERVARLEPQLASRVAVAPMSARAGLDDTLDWLASGYVVQFLRRRGIDPAVAQTITWPDLISASGVLPKFERLLRAMVGMLQADGLAAGDASVVQFAGATPLPDLEAIARQARDRYPEMTPLFDLLDTCAGNLHRAMTGDAPPLEFIFGEGHHDVFRRATENIRAHSSVPLCEEVIRQLLSDVAQAPRERPLRILEIGGGEGLLTEALLPVFATTAAEYHFTDISRSFVANAERRSAARGHRFMRFGVLDISRSPGEQGFAAGSFDVVVAFNVMHATRNVAESLAHARQLLAPGGLLVMQESVRPARWIDLIWGLTDGWWAFEDEPLRRLSPLLDLDRWSEALRNAGFDRVESLPQEPSRRSAADTGVIVARNAAGAVGASTAPATATGDDLRWRDRIAALERLESIGAEVDVVAADVSDKTAMQAVVDRALQRFGRIDGVIHAALTLEDGVMQSKTRASAARVLAPKVAGTLVLKELCAPLRLDFFALFSSLVSILGGRGQVDYCAASSFQDAFAHAEHGRLAKSVVSINWGAWREVGKAFRAAVERGVPAERALPDGMSPAEGLDAFARVLGSRLPQVLVSPQDPAALLRLRPEPAVRHDADAAPAAVGSGTQDAAAAAAGTLPRTETERVIAGIWQDILGIPQIGVEDNFFDLGGDSVISLQFVAKANKAGLRFTNRQVFEHQTVAELATVAERRAVASGT